jgi:hypothetical protein
MEPSFATMTHDLDDCGKLNDWETDFVDSMLHKMDHDPELDELSEKQQACLRKIWTKLCG